MRTPARALGRRRRGSLDANARARSAGGGAARSM